MSENPTFLDFEDEIRSALAVRPASPEFVNRLGAELEAKIKRGAARTSARRSTFFLHPAWAIGAALIVLLALTTWIVGPQRVLAAFRSLFGYIPGIGMVQNDAGLRVLAGPATLTRDGITVKVENGASDQERTILVFSVDGITPDLIPTREDAPTCGGALALLLPDGSLLTQTGGEGNGWDTGYRSRMTFPALPQGADQATLFIPCLMDTRPGVAQDWQIPLRFQPAPPDMQVLPVYELPAPQVAQSGTIQPRASQTPPAATQSAALTPSPAPKTLSNVAEKGGVRFSLERVAELADGYQLQGILSWQNLPEASDVGFTPYHVLSDASGQPIPVEPASLDSSGNTPEKQISWALQTASRAYPGPWTISIPSVTVRVTTEAPFEIDLGADPKVGAEHPLGQKFSAAGHAVTLQSYSLSQDAAGVYWINLTFSGEKEVYSLSFWDRDNHSARIGGKGGLLAQSMSYDQKPTGLHHFTINQLTYTLAGPWEMIWQPPAPSASITRMPEPKICLDPQVWTQIRAQPPAALPSGLAGLVLTERNTGKLMPQLALSNLDGSQARDVAVGGWDALSPDGATVAYIESNGPAIMLIDVKTNQAHRLAGTTSNDYSPRWSPDGNWIAFVRTSERAVYRVHPDGSGLNRIFTGNATLSLFGWLPGSHQIVVSITNSSGTLIQSIDVETGAVKKLATATPKSSVAISPDGSQIAFADKVFGQIAYGLYLVRLDNQEKRLIANLDTLTVAPRAWSPDGRWLLAESVDYGPDGSTTTPFLVQPDTCQVVLLPHLPGSVTGWVEVP